MKGGKEKRGRGQKTAGEEKEIKGHLFSLFFASSSPFPFSVRMPLKRTCGRFFPSKSTAFQA